MALQKTLKDKVTFTGIGVHSGRETTVTLRPAEAGTGIVFHRVDLAPAVSIEAIAANVVNTRLSTTIGRGGATVSTVEHLMAALASCGVDNAHVDIDGAEVPIMDGSAAPFVAAIRRAGVKILSRPKKYLVVKKPVTVADGDKKVTIIPSRYFRISFDMRFNHPAVANQYLTMRFDEEGFAAAFAPARTFGFLAEVEMLKANGLARGGSLENAIVIGDDGVLNPEGLRFADEFVRHKILDTVGDLTLAGYPILGHVKATRSGHDMNHRLVTELLARTDCWKLVEFGERKGDQEVAIPLVVPDLAWSKG
ncbi:UDP-3-O-acyl-N-acetylglucosamine deacetylase [Geobacter sp.]|uniref:UDP-3-O-acyl-N-acetylglucosamine deacetylase n=1 Tax=Geobacter sp. TaxID=46610 RepID=UPI0027BAEDD0|nr:UDP-3-O-acyl-N-acetylglucosamine deacetylase [Geobacter sp.]